MYISKKWLSDWVDIPKDKTPEQLGLDLTLHVVEVEGYEDQAKSLDKIVVGKVVSLKKHPNADSLQLCTVDIGTEKIPVVCGGSNLREGMFIAMGCVGASVRWHGEGDLITLTKAKIRGEVSMGMICAAEEIGLGEQFPKADEKEILDLTDLVVDSEDQLGEPLATFFGMDDIIFDVDNKSMNHRPDLWGHYGFAREIAAMYDVTHKAFHTVAFEEGNDVAINVDVQAKELCSRYMAIAMDGIEITPSPDWMQAKLRAVGLVPKNNIVDITNYVMYELGQPMHAFDGDKITKNKKQKTIIVRNAREGEIIRLIGDEEDVVLGEEMLVIGNGEKAVALAGVKGGDETAVSDTTTRIVFEAATFDAATVRRAAMKLGNRTDSSARFEKTLDPTLPALALKHAVGLVMSLCPNARVVSNIADYANFELNRGPITLPLDFVEKRIGMTIPKEDMVGILERLGFGVTDDGDSLDVSIPSWRASKDISIREDLIEEIARMYGYDNITPRVPLFPIEAPEEDSVLSLAAWLKQFFAYEAGYSETMNYSFVSPEWLGRMGIETDRHIELDNPIQKDKPLIRRSLTPGLLANVEKNLHEVNTVKLFEVGRTYLIDAEGEWAETSQISRLPKQELYLTAVYSSKTKDTPFFAMSEMLRLLNDRLGVSLTIEEAKAEETYVHNGRMAYLHIDGQALGRIYEIHPATQQTLGIPHRVAVVEVNVNLLAPFVKTKRSYNPLAAYPAVERDVALVADESVSDEAIRRTISAVDPLIREIALFDVYRGEHVEEGKKSMAYRLTYRSDEETLRSEDVDVLQVKVLETLQSSLGVRLRS